jgi:hypothetical protein
MRRAIFPCYRTARSKGSINMKENRSAPTFNFTISRFMTTEKDKNQDVIKADGKKEGRMKQLMKKYGFLSIVMYCSLYATTLSGIFLALDNEIFNARLELGLEVRGLEIMLGLKD